MKLTICLATCLLTSLLFSCKKEDFGCPERENLPCKIISKCEGMCGEGEVTTKFHYINCNQLATEEVFDESDNRLSAIVYEYENEKLTTKKHYNFRPGNENPPPDFTYQYEYDASGNLIRETTSGGYKSRTEYEYEDNLLKKESHYTADGNLQPNWLSYYIEYEYDDLGRKIKAKQFRTDGYEGFCYTYEYEGIRLTKRSLCSDPEHPDEFIYDERGNLIQELGFTYTYDEKNRIISRSTWGIDTFETQTYKYCD